MTENNYKHLAIALGVLACVDDIIIAGSRKLKEQADKALRRSHHENL